jgi:hypothetical protein
MELAAGASLYSITAWGDRIPKSARVAVAELSGWAMKSAFGLLFTLLLVGCNGLAPMLTCQDRCVESGWVRDSFCVCQDYRNVGVPGPRPPVDGTPYLASDSVADNCTFQKRRRIYNPRSEAVDVRIAKKERDGSLTGVTRYYWFTVNAKATTPATGVDLGLQYDGGDCFDRDFFISTWRKHQTGTHLLVATELSLPVTNFASTIEALSTLDPATEEYLEQLKKMHASATSAIDAYRPATGVAIGLLASSPSTAIREEIREIRRLDCAQLCQAGDPNCLRNLPPDVDRIRALRDRILSAQPGSAIGGSEMMRILGINGATCQRSDATLDQRGRVESDGDPCAYPLLLKPSDRTPVAAIHVGYNVSGDSVAGPGGGSLFFNRPFATPYLAFRSLELQSDYGGRILEMSANAKGVYLNAGSACVSLGLLQ